MALANGTSSSSVVQMDRVHGVHIFRKAGWIDGDLKRKCGINLWLNWDVDTGNDGHFPPNSTSSWFWSVKLMKLIRPKWDFNFLKCGTPVPDFHWTTSKVSEAWLSDPVLRTTLLCWILKGDNGWKRRKNSGDGKGPCDRAVEQSKLQTYAKIKRQVSSMITLWLYILCHGSWIRIYWQLMAIG